MAGGLPAWRDTELLDIGLFVHETLLNIAACELDSLYTD